MPPAKPSLQELVSFVEELKRQWVATLDALVDPLMIVTADFTISKANRAMATFCQHEDIRTLIGKKCYEAFAQRQAPCTSCRMLEATAQQSACHYHLDQIQQRYFEVTSQPIFASTRASSGSEPGSVVGCVQVYRDRTEARALQEQLLQSEKLASIGQLAGGFAHEINNPLSGILIFSQMLLRELPKESPFYQDVVEIEAAGQRCKTIVDGLLSFARQQPREQAAQRAVLDGNEALLSALRFAKVHPYAQGIRIHTQLNREPLRVQAERNHLIQLFLNLLQNAFQAMPGGGTLTLSSHQSEKEGQTWGSWLIEDSGIGIAPEHLKRIFDPFFTTKEPGQGTGLGLSICYSLCQEAGGHIEVSSSPNVGSKFHVLLPLYKS